MSEKIVATEENIKQLQELQEIASEILEKIKKLNSLMQDAGNEGFTVTLEQDVYKTDMEEVPLLIARVSMKS